MFIDFFKLGRKQSATTKQYIHRKVILNQSQRMAVSLQPKNGYHFLRNRYHLCFEQRFYRVQLHSNKKESLPTPYKVV